MIRQGLLRHFLCGLFFVEDEEEITGVINGVVVCDRCGIGRGEEKKISQTERTMHAIQSNLTFTAYQRHHTNDRDGADGGVAAASLLFLTVLVEEDGGGERTTP